MTDKKYEQARERALRKDRYSPSRDERVGELRRLLHGGSFTRYTNVKRMSSSPILPIQDVGIVKSKVRKHNILPNAILVICLLMVALGVAGIIIHMSDLQHEEDGLQDVANTYTTTSSDDSNLPPAVDFASLQQINPEVSGWIYIPGTNVDYPVMTSSVQEKYLRKNIYGETTIPGSIFTDWRDSSDYSNRHMVLYGHHLPSDTMFTQVSRYIEEDSDFFDTHRTVYVETPQTTYVLSVIGAYKIHPDESESVDVEFNADNDFQSYLDGRLERCDVERRDDADRRIMDKLFTLVTCADSGKARAVVECVPVEVYPTSYVANVRERAGASQTTVTEGNAKPEHESSGNMLTDNGIYGWFENILYELSTNGIL